MWWGRPRSRPAFEALLLRLTVRELGSVALLHPSQPAVTMRRLAVRTPVVGLMNLVWMAALALVFLAEKNWRTVLFNRVVGTAVAVLECTVLLYPELLGIVSGAPPDAPSMSGM
jgi:hypothetical protein